MNGSAEHFFLSEPTVRDTCIELHKIMGVEPETRLFGKTPAQVWKMPQKPQDFHEMLSKLGLDLPVLTSKEKGRDASPQHQLGAIGSVPRIVVDSPKGTQAKSDAPDEKQLEDALTIFESIDRPNTLIKPRPGMLDSILAELKEAFGEAQRPASPPIRYVEQIFQQKMDKPDRPVYWHIFLSHDICDWLSNETTISMQYPLRYVELQSANPARRLANVRWEAGKHEKAKLTRITISPNARRKKTPNYAPPPPLDWFIIEFRYREGEIPVGGCAEDFVSDQPAYWLLAFPTVAVVNTGRIVSGSVAKELPAVAWKMAPNKLPLAHGRGVRNTFPDDFMSACASGEGVIEIGL